MILRSTRRRCRKVILFIGANSIVNRPLALDEECAAIERELRMAEGRDDFDFQSKWAITADDLMRHLNELHPTIIHFSGHGCRANAGCSTLAFRDADDGGARAGGGLYLQNEHGKPRCLDAHGLTMMVKSAATSARVVVLNACYSGVARHP